MDLTTTQRKLLSDYRCKHEENTTMRVNDMVKERLDASIKQTRQSSIQKIRLVDVSSPSSSKSAIFSIWNTNESHNFLRENMFLEVRNASANGMTGKDIQIKGGSYTLLRELKIPPLPEHAAFTRSITPLASIDCQKFKPQFNEFDTIGYVFEMEDVIEGSFQSVFIVDAQQHILCIKIWNGAKNYAFEDVIVVGRYLVVNNLDWRQSHTVDKYGMPQGFVNEYTTFSGNPKSKVQADALNQLRNEFNAIEDLEIYSYECSERLKMKTSNQQGDVSFNTSAIQISILDRSFSESSIGLNRVTAQKKIERLNAYPDPPPLRNYLSSRSHSQQSNTQFKNPFKDSMKQK